MIRIGLTGGIATGKSTASQWLQQQGFPVIDTDLLAREMVLPHRSGLEAIVSRYGRDVLMPDGTLNRRALGEIIFANASEREWLNQLLHPMIFNRIDELVATMHGPVVFIDMPLLYETHYEAFVDQVWVIYVGQDIQVQRLMTRNQWSVEKAKQVIQTQMSIEEKAQRANVLINNEGTIAYLYEQLAHETRQWQSEKLEN